jgi:hypothetical protein
MPHQLAVGREPLKVGWERELDGEGVQLLFLAGAPGPDHELDRSGVIAGVRTAR